MQKYANLDDLMDLFDDVIAAFPDARRQALEAAGEVVRRELDRRIQSELPGRDVRGKVRRWQELTVGSKGGYVKIARIPADRAEQIRKTPGSRTYNSSQITFWLEHGHAVAKKGRNQYGKFRRYEARRAIYSPGTGRSIVTGKQFYALTQAHALKAAHRAAEAALDELQALFDNGGLLPGQTSMEGF